MKILVISKPRYDYLLPLAEFPNDGDRFIINKSINTLSNIGSVVAITLATYLSEIHYTGMIGEDPIGNKIKEILESYKINTNYIETSYTEHTCVNYKVFNDKSKKYTTISENSLASNLTKYKYEFIPDVVLMDNEDYNANIAAINNYPNSKLIYIGEKFIKGSEIYCNKCKYVICSLEFASQATGVVNNLNKEKVIVSLFQKYIDLYNANLIIKLNNFDILYCINNEVRIIKNTNNLLSNKEYLYYSILSYFLINTDNIEESIKYTNKAMLSSGNDIDIIKNIPTKEEVYKLLTECITNIKNNNIVNNGQIVQNANSQPNPNNNQQVNNVVQNTTTQQITNNNQNNATTPINNNINQQINNTEQIPSNDIKG